MSYLTLTWFRGSLPVESSVPTVWGLVTVSRYDRLATDRDRTFSFYSTLNTPPIHHEDGACHVAIYAWVN
jgi:hypothetical protein